MTLFGIQGSHTRREWDDLIRRWGFRCFYCGSPVHDRKPGEELDPEFELTKDHFVPITLGGVDSIENIVPACLHCNRLKGARTGEQFIRERAFVQQHVENNPQHSTGKSLVKGEDVPAFVVHFAEKKKMADRDDGYYQARRRMLAAQVEQLRRRA